MEKNMSQFAYYDPNDGRILQWIDTDTHAHHLPDASLLHRCTIADWSLLQEGELMVQDGQIVPYAAPAPDLALLKWQRLTALNEERDRREAAGFPYLDKLFDSNPLSVQRITAAALAAQSALATNSPFEIEWTAADNSTITLNATELLGMPIALATHAASLHNTARQLKSQVESATTVEEVEAIQWP